MHRQDLSGEENLPKIYVGIKRMKMHRQETIGEDISTQNICRRQQKNECRGSYSEKQQSTQNNYRHSLLFKSQTICITYFLSSQH